ncbi:hypothetical protein [Marinitoga lauensis]|uniref:hypothetical protein n=1 Tax=Marinitoga lauensis TaxID=2201189 RepID=UPI001012C047|nr:hypothetical protein [Marinitoga lauensis]
MKVISNSTIKKIIIFSFLLITCIPKVFSSEIKQFSFDYILTISFNKEYQYKNNHIVLSLPKNSWKNDFDFQWTTNEKGNIIYVFKNLNKFNNANVTVYKIDILENTVKKIKLNTLVPAPFPPWMDILDVYAKKIRYIF